MKKIFVLVPFVAIMFGCQKENSLISPTDSGDEALKTSSTTNYNKVLKSLNKRVESETYCNTDYDYTESVYLDGVLWDYPTTGNENLMYHGLTHVVQGENDYFFAPLEFPTAGYIYGIGFGNNNGPGVYPFTAQVKVCIPEKNWSISYNDATCFAIGNQQFTSTDSIRIVLHKKYAMEPALTLDTMVSFEALKEQLGTAASVTDSIVLYSSIGKVASYSGATVYNWDYYDAGTTEVYGLEDAGDLTYNLNFGDGLADDCSGRIDIFLHRDGITYRCTTSYSIFYTSYTGCRKQLHIYQ